MELEVQWQDHDLGEYPTIVLTWEDAMRGGQQRADSNLMKSGSFRRKKRRKESSRECVWKKNIFAVECASLEGSRRRSASGACSRGLNRLDDGLADGILVSRLVARGVRSKADPWLPS